MATRFVPTKVHGGIDLVTGPALVAAPTLLRLQGVRGSALPPRLIGTAATAYSLLTDYEVGVRRVLPMRRHLALDAVSGTALAAIPWLTGAARQGVRHWLPHAVVGANEVFLALTTRTEPPQPGRMARLPRGALVALPVAAGAVVGVVAWRRRRGAQPTYGEAATSQSGVPEPAPVEERMDVATEATLADDLRGQAADAPLSAAADADADVAEPPGDRWTAAP